jgi:hypothetical protein
MEYFTFANLVAFRDLLEVGFKCLIDSFDLLLQPDLFRMMH